LIAGFYAPERAVRRADGLTAFCKTQPSSRKGLKKIKKNGPFFWNGLRLTFTNRQDERRSTWAGGGCQGGVTAGLDTSCNSFASSERVRLTWPDPYFRLTIWGVLFLAGILNPGL